MSRTSVVRGQRELEQRHLASNSRVRTPAHRLFPRSLEEIPERGLRIVRDRGPVVKTEYGETEVQQPADTGMRSGWICMEFRRDKVYLSLPVHQQVGTKKHARLAGE